MTRFYKVYGEKKEPIIVRVCDSFWSKFFGLMLQKNIDPQEGILIQSKHESVTESAIHMFFMNFEISVFWINRSFQIVDKSIAKPWRPAYFPKYPAMYVLETHSSQINKFEIGEKLIYRNV